MASSPGRRPLPAAVRTAIAVLVGVLAVGITTVVLFTSGRGATPPVAAAPAPAAPVAATPPGPPAPPPDAVWPTAASAVRFDDPIAAARGFATDLVGFPHPVLGRFRVGTLHTGEVDLQAAPGGPVTTALLRQLEDETWWVLGSATQDIAVDKPRAGAALRDTADLSGTAWAFEGHVAVRVVDDSGGAPLVLDSVIGGNDRFRPFTGTFPLRPPTTDRGAIVLTTESPTDRAIWSATVVRVTFER